MKKFHLIFLFIIHSVCCFSAPKEKHIATAVLIHGCHLETQHWDEIMFGDPLRHGRVTCGIEEALREGAEVIIWGSGASMTEEGVKESEQIFHLATTSKLNHLAEMVGASPSELLQFLNRTVILEFDSHNTATEIQSALQICQEKNIEKLVLISSPTHIARCLQEGCKQKGIQNAEPLIYARASDVCFYNSTPHDVVVIEPPHREDKPQPKIFTVMRRLFSLIQDKENGEEFYTLITKFFDQYETQLVEKQSKK